MWHRDNNMFGYDESRPTWKGKWKQQKEVNRIIAVLHLKPPKEDRESYRRYIEVWGEYARIKEEDDRIIQTSRHRQDGF